MARNATWANSDGLIVGFGTHSADNNVWAVTGSEGLRKQIVKVIDLVDLEDTDIITAASYSPQDVVIPRGSLIVKANIVVTVTATTGSTSLLDIGTRSAVTRDNTIDDPNGIDADIDSGLLAVGAAVPCNGALVNQITTVGAVSNSDVIIIAGFETALFTAGQIILTVEYIVPSTGKTVIA